MSDSAARDDDLDWEDCTGAYYVGMSIARGGGGYWPCMVNIDWDELGSGSITADDCRRLAALLNRAADLCDAATREELEAT